LVFTLDVLLRRWISFSLFTNLIRIKKMSESCGKEWEDHWQCLERHNQEFYMCRKPERESNLLIVKSGQTVILNCSLSSLTLTGTLNQCVFEKLVSNLVDLEYWTRSIHSVPPSSDTEIGEKDSRKSRGASSSAREEEPNLERGTALKDASIKGQSRKSKRQVTIIQYISSKHIEIARHCNAAMFADMRVIKERESGGQASLRDSEEGEVNRREQIKRWKPCHR
jgi:hypothetical protein